MYGTQLLTYGEVTSYIVTFRCKAKDPPLSTYTFEYPLDFRSWNLRRCGKTNLPEKLFLRERLTQMLSRHWVPCGERVLMFVNWLDGIKAPSFSFLRISNSRLWGEEPKSPSTNNSFSAVEIQEDYMKYTETTWSVFAVPSVYVLGTDTEYFNAGLELTEG